MSSDGTSLAPSSPQTVSIGMENTPSPSFSITPAIFGFLKSLDLRSVDLNPDMVPLVHLITGWEIVVDDPSVAESKVGGKLSGSAEYTIDMDIGHVRKEHVLDTDSIIVDDIDKDEPILQFKKTVKTAPQPNFQPGIKRQRKTTTSLSISLTPLVSRPRT